MNGKNTQSLTVARVASALVILAAGITAFPTAVSAKSLYVIADKWGNTADSTLPVQAYDIGADGTLAFQAQCLVPNRGMGAIAMAIDPDSGYVFVTYGNRSVIQLLDPVTMTDAGTTEALGASNLTGIVYDHKKKLVYTMDRGSNELYAYQWEPNSLSLTQVSGSPFSLSKAFAFGIAVDEINDRLYVANGRNVVTAYDTSSWELVNTITLSRVATCVAVDGTNNFLYTGGGYAENPYLTQYHIPTGTERDLKVNPEGSVMGVAVDPQSGLVYLTTGLNNEAGGDSLMVYDTGLRQIDSVFNIGSPTGLTIPVKEIGYNQLNLRKTVVGDSGSMTADGTRPVGPGATIRYEIHFENNNSFAATNVSVVDVLPDSVIFLKADNPNGSGHYDSKARRYKWSYPSIAPGSSVNLELTVQVPEDVEIGRTIVNSVTVAGQEIPRTTATASVLAMNNPLGLTKTIFGGPDDQIKGVDINEPITYTICFDNNDNDFSVTDITLVDILPDEVTFVAAGEGKSHGAYDANAHSYTWSYPFLLPGSSVCVGLIVRINPGTAPGTIITNSAIVDSNETLPTTAIADAVMYLSPLSITKTIVGAVGDQPKWVSAGDKITYVISFQNQNDVAVTNAVITDMLPKETTFVRARADDSGVFGRYDPKSHTYTWSYSSLPPAKSPTLLEVVVEVNKGVGPSTTITNTATIDSDQTRPVKATAQAVTFYSIPSLTKYVVGSVAGEVEQVSTNDIIVYAIRFNNDNDSALSNVTIVDTLPQQLSFLSADGDGSSGRYDAKANAYTWTYSTLAPRSSTYLELRARVKQGLTPSTTISNVATVISSETTPSTANADAVVGEGPLRAQSARMVPESINRAGGTYEVQAVVILPAGIGKNDIKDVLPTLYPGRVVAKRQLVYGTNTSAKVVAIFDKAELAAGVPGNGRIQVKVAGKLKSGRSFVGEGQLQISGSASR